MGEMENKQGKSVHDGHRARLKKRMLDEGLLSFQEHNILELVLFYAIPHRDTNELSHRLIREFGSLRRVFDASYEDLLKVKGVGHNVASLLKLVPELSRVYVDKGTPSQFFMRSIDDAYRYLIPKFIGEKDECVILACLDNKHAVIECELLFRGSVNSAELSVRKVIERAIRYNAAAVVLAHNHPGGFAIPSRMDIDTTTKLREALAAISVKLLDHIIVTEELCKNYIEGKFD